TPSEPHHIPFPEAKTSHPTTLSIPLPSIPIVPIPPVTQPVTTPIIQYSRRARIAQSFALPTGKEVIVESDTPKKKKLQEQIDAQVAIELEEKQQKEDIRINEQIARDAEVARIHAEEEL
nr:hypothetical protein [Tanacetum cinerariifolium]